MVHVHVPCRLSHVALAGAHAGCSASDAVTANLLSCEEFEGQVPYMYTTPRCRTQQVCPPVVRVYCRQRVCTSNTPNLQPHTLMGGANFGVLLLPFGVLTFDRGKELSGTSPISGIIGGRFGGARARLPLVEAEAPPLVRRGQAQPAGSDTPTAIAPPLGGEPAKEAA